MRHIGITTLSLLACSCALLFSCQKPPQEEDKPSEKKISVTLEARASSSLSAWSTGDQAAFFVEQADEKPLLAKAANDGKANEFTFEATIAPGKHSIYGFSPASAFKGYIEENTVKLEIPSTQTPTLEGFDPAADLLILTPATVETTASDSKANVSGAKFTALAGGLEIVLEDNTGRDLLKGQKVTEVVINTPGKAICGVQGIDLKRFKPNTWESEGESVRVSTGADFTVDGVKAVKAALAPCVLEAGEAKVLIQTQDYSIEKTLDEAVTITKGVVSTVKIGITAADLGETSEFSGGDGSEAYPFLISCAEDLCKLAEYINDASKANDFKTKRYLQTEDIDLSSVKNFTPIGLTTSNNFRGVYDGASHHIRNFHIDNTDVRPSALFGNVGTGALIKDIIMDDVNIKSTSYYSAAFVGYLYNATISGCSFTGSVWSTGTVSNVCYAAGIAGRAEGSTIENCVCSGNVTTTSNHVGGVVGDAASCKVIGCRLSQGCAVHGSYYSGGVVGVATGDGSEIRGCVCDGQVSAQNWNCGGIAAAIYQGLVDSCVQTSKSMISARLQNAGGILGSIVTGSATGSEKKAVVNNCAAYGDIYGQYEVGGVIGYASAGNAGNEIEVSNCAYIGGELVAQGINAYNYSLIGGVVGYFHGNGSTKMVNCYSRPACITSVMTGTGGVGGVVGYQSSVTNYIDNCYSTVTGSDVLYQNAPITSSSLSYYGSIIGRCSVASPYKHCFYDSSLRMGGKGSLEQAGDCQGISGAKFTDGSLLTFLGDGASQASSTTGIKCSAWVKGADNFPTLEALPANPWPAGATKLRVSIIGDSISSFYGWMPSGYTAHYPNTNNCDVTSVDKTWWYRLIYSYMQNAKLDMNISFSNSTVTQNQDSANVGQYWYGHDFCSRFVECHGMGRPDVIVIHGGTNDYGHNYGEELAPGIPMRSENMPSQSVMDGFYAAADACTTNEAAEALPYNTFCAAYVKLVRMMKVRYPDVRIVCIIGDSVTPGIQQVIKNVAEHYDARVVDLLALAGFRENTYVTKYDAGKVHPNANGMDYMARKIYTEHGAWMERR